MASGLKLKPISDNFALFNDGYRGLHEVAWNLVNKNDRVFEVFATWCPHCKQAWGWTPVLSQIQKLRKAIAVYGCPKCPKKSSRKRQVTRAA